ncbi:extracellular superoxide dismutase [Cu-Zn]-like [Pseudophryne corroboree]|uniref:extracellular superoxide dismutase [Cu-Zn]-like n=1 Tax=Pseudophryne corroboree TaxID=495146 RepID=UPI003081EF87
MCHTMYPTVIFFILVCFGAKVDVGQASQAEMIADISQKVNQLYDVLLQGTQDSTNRTIYAICNLQPNPKLNSSDLKITGQVLLKQTYPYGNLEAVFTVEGFPMDANQSVRAIHIHSYGDLSNGCDSAGGHYNPFSVNHPDHPGDFGNFRVRNGKIQQHLTNLEANLFGPYSAVGKSIVVHKLADDLGKGDNQASLENGNAGARLACCVIGSSSKTNWDKYMQDNAMLKNPRVSRRVKQQRSKNYS